MGFDKCVKRNGKIYCWDQEAKEIKEIILKSIELEKCDPDVLLDLLSL